jgi:hypothetical protein
MSVKRWTLAHREKGSFMEEVPLIGGWVKYSDYAALEQENEDLRLGYVDLLKSKAADSPLMARIAALEQERDELKELNRGVSQLWRDTMEREARLREAIREHKHSCVKCGDCDFWDRYERRLTEGEK